MERPPSGSERRRDRGARAVRRGAVAVGGPAPTATPSTTGCARRSAGWRGCAGRSSSATTARRRRVRAAGAHGMSTSSSSPSAHVTVESAPIAAQALREDRVVEIAGDVSDQFPDRVRRPVPRAGAAGVRADGRGRPRGRRDPRRPAAVRARRSTTPTATCCGRSARPRRWPRWRGSSPPRPRLPRQLEHRIDLAREIHEGVIQRLFGVSMALDGEGDLPATARQRCATETQAALVELRAALQRPLGRAPRATQTTFDGRGRAGSRACTRSWGSARAPGDAGPGGARAAGPVGAGRGRPQRRQARQPDAGDGAVEPARRHVRARGRQRRRQRTPAGGRDGAAAGGAGGAAERRRDRVRRAGARDVAGATGRARPMADD